LIVRIWGEYAEIKIMIRDFLFLERQVGLILSLSFFFMFIYTDLFGHKSFNSDLIFLFCSVATGLIAIIRPLWLSTISIIWMQIGKLMSKLLNPVLILLIYLISIIPTALLLKLFRIDLLDVNCEPGTDSYWQKPPNVEQDMTKQF